MEYILIMSFEVIKIDFFEMTSRLTTCQFLYRFDKQGWIMVVPLHMF